MTNLRRNPLAFFCIILLIVLTTSQLSSQAPGTPMVAITSIPVFGQNGQLQGNVSAGSAKDVSLYLFIFVADLGWYNPAGCGPIPIQNTGTFAVDLSSSIIFEYSTRFNAYLVPNSIPIPCVQAAESIPFIVDRNALARVTMPRLPQYKTLSFAGLDWYVKTAPLKVYPGPQFFVNDNAFVDAAGRLHLKVSRCLDSWCAAEIFTKDRVGYGTYTFTIDSQLNNLDANTTLGLFTWDEIATEQFHREWDIEFSRWGNAGAALNTQYVVQPYTGPNNMYRFPMTAAAPSTHTVTWTQNQVGFISVPGSGSPGAPAIAQWSFSGGAFPVPPIGDARLHLNYYVADGKAPSVPVDREIIISRLQYNSLGAEIGFSQTQDSPSFVSGISSVPISGSSASCDATVETDSPWLSPVNPNPFQAGLTVQYSVSDNQGAARTGNLILHSTNCDLTVGRQVLTVNQSGLVCDASFAAGSAHLGFIAAVRSFLIKAASSVCSWSLTSNAPWLRITSASSGTGNGQVQISSDPNGNPDLRFGALTLSNGKQLPVYQDAVSSMFALSPLIAITCSATPIQAPFAVSWVSTVPGVEIWLNSPSGTLLGRFAPTGTYDLPNLSDGTLIYLLESSEFIASPRVLASARATVTPGDCTSPAISPRGLVNAASYSAVSVAPGSLATLFGQRLSNATAQANSVPFPLELGGVSLLIDGTPCPLSFVSSGQINFSVPASIVPGRHTLSQGSTSVEVNVTSVAPGIFTVSGNGSGVPVIAITAVLVDGSSQTLPAYAYGAGGCTVVPIIIPAAAKELYLVLYGTGFRNLTNVSASLGPVAAEVVFAGPHSQFPGVDQINLHITNLDGLSGQQLLRIRPDGIDSNTVQLTFR